MRGELTAGMRLHTLLLWVFTVVTANGCATTRVMPYESPDAYMGVPRDRMLAAVEKRAQAQGWTVVERNDLVGVVEVLTPATSTEGMITRERWYFREQNGRLSAQRVFEVRWSAEDPSWNSEKSVAPSYQYFREREELAAISRVLDDHQPVKRDVTIRTQYSELLERLRPVETATH